MKASQQDAERSGRRRFSAEYKLRILRAAEACRINRSLGELLQAEGLSLSHLTKWRKQAESGALAWLSPKKRGPAPRRAALVEQKLREKDREIAKWKRRAERAEALSALHGTLSTVVRSHPRSRNAVGQARRLAPEYGVAAVCAALGIARATYYRRLAHQRRDPSTQRVADR